MAYYLILIRAFEQKITIFRANSSTADALSFEISEIVQVNHQIFKEKLKMKSPLCIRVEVG